MSGASASHTAASAAVRAVNWALSSAEADADPGNHVWNMEVIVNYRICSPIANVLYFTCTLPIWRSGVSLLFCATKLLTSASVHTLHYSNRNKDLILCPQNDVEPCIHALIRSAWKVRTKRNERAVKCSLTRLPRFNSMTFLLTMWIVGRVPDVTLYWSSRGVQMNVMRHTLWKYRIRIYMLLRARITHPH